MLTYLLAVTTPAMLGFQIPHHDKISLFHRLTRTRVGVALFVILMLGFSIVPSTIYPITFLFIISTGLVKQSTMRKLSDYIPGCWIYSVAVSNTAQYCIVIIMTIFLYNWCSFGSSMEWVSNFNWYVYWYIPVQSSLGIQLVQFAPLLQLWTNLHHHLFMAQEQYSYM